MRNAWIIALTCLLITAGPAAARRRRVAPSGCLTPVVSLRITPNPACPNDQVTLEWTTRDPRATVSITGFRSGLPASGSGVVSVIDEQSFIAFAANVCGNGPPVTATVRMPPEASGTLTAPATLTQNATTTLSFTVSGAATWSLQSTLGNGFSRPAGSGSGSFTSTYTANRSGADQINLVLVDACGRQTIVGRGVQITPVTQPPPGNSGLLCCDGTRSPMCFSCADQRGCCSSHRGVCGCP